MVVNIINYFNSMFHTVRREDVLKNLENKSLGMKDVVRAYRKVILELKHILKE